MKISRRFRLQHFGARHFSSSSNNVVPPYEKLISNLHRVRQHVAPDRPLTLAEKIIMAHIHGPISSIPRGTSYIKLTPDRVAMQDASAQMALLQFMLCGRSSTAVPTSIHCDHLIEATQEGADKDVERSLSTEAEIYHFLKAAARKFGIAFWKPGSGIIHQIVLENYAAPGALMLGTDSHTPNAGGLGMMAIGVGGADAVDAMAGIPWELKMPKTLGVHLKGSLHPWVSPKDVILTLAGLLTVRGGTGYILEYFGEGVQSLSCTGMATMANMGAEVGATTSVFPYTEKMAAYLRMTGRKQVADAADRVQSETRYLSADPGAEKLYDRIIELDLFQLEPRINGPFTPDASIPLSEFKQRVVEKQWPVKLKAALIGSCTNSSYQDISRAASIAKQAQQKGLKAVSDFYVTPGSEQIRATIERDGQMKALQDVGGQVLANACGPCIGQWDRVDIEKGESNAILTSYNRNFRARNDGNSETMNFLASPEIVTAMAFAGRLTFNPLQDTLTDAQGRAFKFEPPVGDELPSHGFAQGRSTYQPPSFGEPVPDETIQVDPSSSRLQLLEPFDKWHGKELTDLFPLVKVRGKCTTDHISAAGKWLKYKGHLDNIANNTLIGAVNDATGVVNQVASQLDGRVDTIPNIARQYKAAQQPWLVIADHNYGEGSAREHAALQPRYLGCVAIVAKSFARIHETNLKKQGVLPLTFKEAADYDRIPAAGVRISTRGLVDLVRQGEGEVELVVTSNETGNVVDSIPVRHTMSPDQLKWFQHGSALNMIRQLQQQQDVEKKAAINHG
jgi:aconitate hydratase